MKSVLKKYKDLPLEVGKVYQTKFQTGEKVFLKEIILSGKSTIARLGVIYENAPHLGVCPLSPERLIAEKVFDEEVLVCDKCNEPI